MLFNEWMEIVLYKKKPAELVGITLGEGIKQLLIASVIYGIIFGIAAAILAYIDPNFGTEAPLFAIITLVLSAVAVPIISLLGMLLGGGILHLLCMAFGGKGTYDGFVGVLAEILAAFTGTIFALLALIQVFAALGGDTAFQLVGEITSIISIITFLWGLALYVLAAKAVHKLSLGKAIAAAAVIPVLILIIFVILMLALIIAVIASMVPEAVI